MLESHETFNVHTTLSRPFQQYQEYPCWSCSQEDLRYDYKTKQDKINKCLLCTTINYIYTIGGSAK